MKHCITCSKSFTPNVSFRLYCSNLCKHNSPNKKATNKAYQQSRRDIINKIKMDKGCFKCGYKAHAAALDFNHVRGDKKFNVSQDPKVALHRLMAEIDKCEVLCANCHRIHTFENRHWQANRKDRNENTLV